MQLNNENGKSIVLDKIDVNQNRIVYSTYEYGGSGHILAQTSYTFTSVTLSNYLDVSINYTTFCYDTLVVEKEKEYVRSEDDQNWIIDEATGTNATAWAVVGSAAGPTTIRVYVPANTLNSVMNSENDLDLLIKEMEGIEELIARLSQGTHYYLVSLSESARATLEAYPEIIIEDKL